MSINSRKKYKIDESYFCDFLDRNKIKSVSELARIINANDRAIRNLASKRIVASVTYPTAHIYFDRFRSIDGSIKFELMFYLVKGE